MMMDAKDPNAPLWAALDQAAASLAGVRSPDHELITAALESIGRLLAAGAPEDELRARTCRLLNVNTLDPARIEGALESEEAAEALESAASGLVEELLEAAAGGGDGPEGGAEQVAAYLGVRDRAELALLGAAFAMDRPVDSVAAGAAGRLGFDLAVRPHAFLLVAYNMDRAWRSGWVHRRHRARFWWWFEGLPLDPRAVHAMSAVASLVARSSGARERFESLVRAEEAMVGLAWARAGEAPAGRAQRDGGVPARHTGSGATAPGGRPAKVVRLREWIERRAAGGQAGLALAAAPLDEVLLIETPDAHVSWSAPGTLIVDLLSDRRPGSTPALVAGNGAVMPCMPVRGAEERFAVAVGPEILDGERVCLRLPLAGGDVEIDLPPRDIA